LSTEASEHCSWLFVESQKASAAAVRDLSGGDEKSDLFEGWIIKLYTGNLRCVQIFIRFFDTVCALAIKLHVAREAAGHELTVFICSIMWSSTPFRVS